MSPGPSRPHADEGDFPGWGSPAQMRLPLVLAVTTMLSLFLGARHTPRVPILLAAGWTAAVYLAIPLAVIVLLEARTRVGRAVGAAAALAVLLPCLSRVLASPVRAWFKLHPGVIVVVLAVSVGLSLSAARQGGVDLRRWGLGLGDWAWWGKRAAWLALAVLALVGLGAMIDPGLLEYYPDWKGAREDPGALMSYIASFGLYFVGWEFCFRGFLLFGFARTSGPMVAVLLQALPFFLMHRGGPQSEMVASFFGGALLAAFCYRARSFWPAVVLHWTLNAAMNAVGFIW